MKYKEFFKCLLSMDGIFCFTNGKIYKRFLLYSLGSIFLRIYSLERNLAIWGVPMAYSDILNAVVYQYPIIFDLRVLINIIVVGAMIILISVISAIIINKLIQSNYQ